MLANSRCFSRSFRSASILSMLCVPPCPDCARPTAPSRKAAEPPVQVVGAGLHQMVGDGLDVAVPPILESRSLDPLVEGTERRAGMHLKVDALLPIPLQR